jgi:hypothetical protein
MNPGIISFTHMCCSLYTKQSHTSDAHTDSIIETTPNEFEVEDTDPYNGPPTAGLIPLRQAGFTIDDEEEDITFQKRSD